MVISGGQYDPVLMHVAETEAANGTTADCLSGPSGAFTTLTMQITGISGETITFEGTVDGTNYVAISTTNLNTGAAATTATADGLYRVTCLGLLKVRARISTASSGTVYVTGYLVA